MACSRNSHFALGTSVGVVIVHYYNTSDVVRFIRSLARVSMPDGHTRRIIIVDNSGDLNRPTFPADEDVVVVRPGQNLGYINGCSQGIEAYKEKYGEHPAWWIVANADVRLSPVFFQRLLRESWSESTALLSPDIREGKSWPRNPFHRNRPSSFWVRCRIALLSTTLLTASYVQAARWKRSFAQPPSIAGEPKRIYATHGSLMVFHRRFFNLGGSLTYGGFLYGEEIHIAEQVRQMNLDIRWAPSLRASHRGKAVMDHVSIDQRRRWWKESYEYLYQTYFQTD